MKRARNCFNFPFNCNFGYTRHVEHRKGGKEEGMQNENRNSKKRERGEEKRLETVEFVYYSDTTTTGSMFAQFLSPATRRKYY